MLLNDSILKYVEITVVAEIFLSILKSLKNMTMYREEFCKQQNQFGSEIHFS